MLAILRLVRFAGVFTAIADILAGYFILNLSGLNYEHIANLPFVIAASCCFYLCGMAWNDIFDAQVDAIERPTRPIPSGKVSMTGAFMTATILSFAGILFAMAAGMASFLIGGILLCMILLYDGALKDIPLLGPLSMGSCRGLNILLGMSAHTYFTSLLSHPLVFVPPIILTVYITAVTVLSSLEGDEENCSSLEPAKSEDPEAPTEIEQTDEIDLHNPLEGQRLSQITRKRELDIVLTQNKLDPKNSHLSNINDAPPGTRQQPPLVLWSAIACIVLIPVAAILILPFNLASLGAIGLLLALLAKPVYTALIHTSPVAVCKLVGSSIVGICLLDAAILLCAAITPMSRQSLLTAGFIAILILPATILRRYIAIS